MSGVLSAVLFASISLLTPLRAHAPDEPSTDRQRRMFAISAEQADHLLQQALSAEFPLASLQRVSDPNPGFGVVSRYATHAYTISAHRVPATGRRPDGSLIDGYRFEVQSSGTMPTSSRARATRLERNLQSYTSLIAPAWPLVREAAIPATGNQVAPRHVPDWLVLVVLTVGIVIGMATGSRLALPERPQPPTSRVGQQRPSQSDATWWNSELLEMTHDAVIVWEMDGAGILYWNQAAEQLYGFDREHAQGKVTHELLRTRLAGSVSELQTRLARYGVWVGELRHTTRDGRQIAVEGRLALLSQRNGRWLVLEVNRDLSDRTRAATARSAMEDRMIRLRNPAATPST